MLDNQVLRYVYKCMQFSCQWIELRRELSNVKLLLWHETYTPCTFSHVTCSIAPPFPSGSASPPEYTPPPPFLQARSDVVNRDDYHLAMKPPLQKGPPETLSPPLQKGPPETLSPPLQKGPPETLSPPLQKGPPVLESTPHSHSSDLSNVLCPNCGVISRPSQFEEKKDLNGVPFIARGVDGPRVAPSNDSSTGYSGGLYIKWASLLLV